MSIADLGTSTLEIENITVDSISFNGGTPMSTYGATGLNGTISGIYTNPIACAGLYRVIGKRVMFGLSNLSNLSDNNGILTYSVVLPNRPQQEANMRIFIEDASVIQAGNCKVSVDGVVTIYKGYNGVFTGASQTGFKSFTVFYDCV